MQVCHIGLNTHLHLKEVYVCNSDSYRDKKLELTQKIIWQSPYWSSMNLSVYYCHPVIITWSNIKVLLVCKHFCLTSLQDFSAHCLWLRFLSCIQLFLYIQLMALAHCLLQVPKLILGSTCYKTWLNLEDGNFQY